MADFRVNDYSRLRVEELKKILGDRGVPCAGKRKEELLELVGKAVKTYEVKGECDHDESERKRRRVFDADGNIIVDLNGKQIVWDRQLRSLPRLSLGDVFAYLVKHCGWTPERLCNYKGDDGFLMYKDNHIENVLEGVIHDHKAHVYIKGSVKPEQRQTAQRYDTWILLSNEARVISAGCGCVAADDGSCKHAVALLFAVADFVTRQTDSGTAVGTDVPCVWTIPRKASMPAKVQDLDFRQERKIPKAPGPDPLHYQPLKNDNVNVNNIQQHLRKVCEDSHPGALFLKLVKDPPAAPQSTVPSIRELYKEYTDSSQSVPFTEYLKKVTTDQHIETLKNLKQSDGAWLEARKCRITASTADMIRSVKNLNKCSSLTNKILGVSKTVSSDAIDFGNENEPVARGMYAIEETAKHKNFEVHECGLYILKDKPYIGASPDGVISCTCREHDEEKLLEIKCSFKHRNIKVAEIPTKDPDYHLEVVNNTLSLKKTSPWYSQIQYQMGVTNLKSCDLVVYTKKGIEIIHVPLNMDRWELLLKKAELVFVNVILPLL